MKARSLSVAVIMTTHNAGAFVGHPAGAALSSKLKYGASSVQQQHQQRLHSNRQHQGRHQRRSLDSYAPPHSRITRRRPEFRAPRVMLMSSAGGENSEAGSSSSSSSGSEENKTEDDDESTGIPSEQDSDNDTTSAATTGDADTATQGGGEVAQSEEATGEKTETAEGGEKAKEKKEKEKEAEEEEGETVFLPTGDNKDFRLFRAKLRAGSDEKWKEQLKRNVNIGQLAGQDAWAHELSAPEKGCLIVAKSTEFTMAQTYFNEAVIFLASHDEMGSAGFILNRPTSVQLGDLVEGNALPQFRKTPLYLGGDVGEGNVQIMHPFGPDKLSNSMEIIPGVYIGGAVDEADRMVATGKAKRDDFKFMLHLCGWAPGQLEAEIERGVWLSVATSTNVILKHCLRLPVPMWREVMTLMGPKYGLLARDTYDDL